MDPSLISTGFKTITAFAQATNSVSKFKKLYHKYISKTTRVLVVGESGSGKTQFINALVRVGGKVKQSTMNVNKVELELADGHMIEFTDTPGQQSLESQRKAAINDICRQKYQGIINVVCYGYQSSSDTKIEDVFKVGTSEVKSGYLETNRKKELKQIEEWLPRIDGTCKLKWVLTVMNKADVWYAQMDEVKAYYGSAYTENLSKISQFKSIANIPYCSIIAPFCDKPMEISMGDQEKMIMHNGLCKQLAILMDLTWN